MLHSIGPDKSLLIAFLHCENCSYCLLYCIQPAIKSIGKSLINKAKDYSGVCCEGVWLKFLYKIDAKGWWIHMDKRGDWSEKGELSVSYTNKLSYTGGKSRRDDFAHFFFLTEHLVGLFVNMDVPTLISPSQDSEESCWEKKGTGQIHLWMYLILEEHGIKLIFPDKWKENDPRYLLYEICIFPLY